MHLAARADTFDGLVYLISHAWRQMRVFHAEKKRTPKTEDSLAERDEFEPSVPLIQPKNDQFLRLCFLRHGGLAYNGGRRDQKRNADIVTSRRRSRSA
jgi:hypothetical protein